MKNKLVRVLVFAIGGVSIWYTGHWATERAVSLGGARMFWGELAVFLAGALAISGMISFGTSIAKRPGPRALPQSPTSSPDVA